ncbi:TrbG/VirB9 family P-type conjugative transfer protein [Phenylobacterium sp.]|uniref:TrbG/VirB9 family P-type conjugative transfer protein n=1 Tax=Phenylobacterium sp. TaxID=1871053 RepID=UPI00121B0E63|nr:TrbG/VirB9 family P-type conjugative transfer protein [Phenylobacterium sp.]THD63898.1 MAG: P-type conjugative transfer protein VirB9 [Phenylobacterium sp.]
MRSALFCLALAVTPVVASAAEAPRPGYLDPHIQSVHYDPDQVVLLQGVLGYQLMLEFAPDEQLQSVSIGDSLGWQVVPNHNANLLFLKPLERNAATNMNVVTTQRRYAFELRVLPKGGAKTANAIVTPYIVRFVYPPVAVAVSTPAPPDPPPEERNRAYVVTGAAENTPARIFDDGRMTYFAWQPQASVPAIFAVGADGKESLVNYGVRGAYTVVEQVSPRFVLRNGKQVATVINQGFVPPAALPRSGAK